MAGTIPAQAAGGNTQVILSTTHLLVDYSVGGSLVGAGPAGFWIWSTNTTNSYGNGGQGSIYFYGVVPVQSVEPAQVVDGTVSISGPTVSEEVRASGIDCSLSATLVSPGKGVLNYLNCSLLGGGATASLPSPEPVTMNISRS